MNKVCAVTGSFDPVTLGHVNIAKRAAEIFDRVYVLMLINPDKDYLFSVEDRLKMLRQAFADMPRIEVAYYDGYTADFCKKNGINCLVRGVRNKKDLAYEQALAKANLDYGGIETYFLDAQEDLSDISSCKVREYIAEGKALDGLVPKAIINTIKEIKANG